jgi:hypothetical protein
MGTPTTSRDYLLSSAVFEKLNVCWGRVRTASVWSSSTVSGHRSLAGSRRLAGGVRGIPP